ncbi:S-adenosyl-L-methionine-dependent methyltransferase [Xylariomycetidae sp. FL2044]|nr:S-adenosyl-L-methionine-dependent methyltransferase [Xylariomycetidae sp. FL2044]
MRKAFVCISGTCLNIKKCNYRVTPPRRDSFRRNIRDIGRRSTWWFKVNSKYSQRITEGTVAKPVQAILERLNALRPFEDASGILDNGSGPGLIMSKLIEQYYASIPRSCSLICSDYSSAMIGQVLQNRKAALERDAGSLWARVDVRVLDALDLKTIQDDSLSHVAAGLVSPGYLLSALLTDANSVQVYNLTTDPQKCLMECRRVLEPNGALAVSAWEGNDWLDMMKVITNIKPELSNAVSPKWSSASAISTDLEQAGFRDIQVQSIPIAVEFQTHDKFVHTLLTFQPRMVALLKQFTEDQKATLKKLLIEEMQVYCPTEPGALNGTVLVATGRK